MLLGEKWLSEKHLINLDINGYRRVHIFGQKSHGVKKDRQSCGISVYFREELKDKILVVDKNDCGIIWIELSNELFHFNEDVYLCYVYIPPTSSKVLKDKDFDFFEEIEKGLEKYSKLGKTYVTRDFNARTVTLSVILDFDAYLDSNADTRHIFDISSLPIRQNQDNITDSNGQKLISLCKSTGHIIANGRLFTMNRIVLHFVQHVG